MAIAPEQLRIGIRRQFTTAGTHPYDTVEWERRDARIPNFKDGGDAFFQPDCEFPKSWSVNASNIVAQKYFRGTLGTAERESSLKEVVDRIVDTVAEWGINDGYFADEAEADAFRDELKFILVHQQAAFNSPVWFNIGVKGVPQQGSACFILAVDDTMDSILNWYREEGTIFKGGSGAGVNLSKIRSSKELLKGGGTASGPVSFMRGADSSAGTIKSGGKTRRAAKMVILNVDHPDVEEFIWCKAREEQKARALREAGFDMSLDGIDIHSVQYQNANNSVRVTDDFMRAVENDTDWTLRAVTDGSAIRTLRARDLWRQLAQASWECADPGLQFDTTVNHWHTAANTGRINGSNPCFTADTLVHTSKGLIRFDELFDRANRGEQFRVYTHDATNPDAPESVMRLTTPEAFMITGLNPIVRLRFDNGMEVRCTPSHRIFTTNRGYVEAADLSADDSVRSLDLAAPSVDAEWCLPVETDADSYRSNGDHRDALVLPDAWSEEFAHYLGWLVGDGTTSGASTATIYGSLEDQAEILPRHAALVETINGGRPLKVSDQANGTAQLRLSRRPFKRFLEALGIRSVTGADKAVPWSIEQAPTEVVAAFLRGLFDADGCAVHNPTKGSYVGLGSISFGLLQGVQRLLSTFGIASKVYNVHEGSDDAAFTYIRSDGAKVSNSRKASYDLRISSRSISTFAAEIGFTLSRKATIMSDILRERSFYDVSTTIHLATRIEEGTELTYNLSEPRNHSYVANGVVVRNCSEYMHLDNSACNLASINLLKYLRSDDTFDVDAFRHTVEVVFTAQEIIVGNADYPTEPIAKNSRDFRQLGLGYANLGALLMALGLPYNSDGGRAWAASITALMTGHAYATSAKTASRMGPFAGYAENREHMLRVLSQHRDAAVHIDDGLVPTELVGAARESWDDAVEWGDEFGVRNSQATVLAPTGTIGLALDCDTTGIEPDLALTKAKKLVGGGTMLIVNQTIPRALRQLGYREPQVESIVAYIDVNKTIVGAPGFDPSHLDVFACSMGDNTIHYMGHVKMMGAVQPFISGAISKTVNLPEDVTVEDVESVHLQAWKLGLKAVALYRDNCKVAQPLSTQTKGGAAEGGERSSGEHWARSSSTERDHGSGAAEGGERSSGEHWARSSSTERDHGSGAAEGGERSSGEHWARSSSTERDHGSGAADVAQPIVERIIEHVIVQEPIRQKLPRTRSAKTFSFRVADCHGYVTVGEYEGGRPGEVFLQVAKQGSTLAGIMDAFAISVSHGLQYGVPLEAFVGMFTNMRFEPAGMTDDPDIRFASSLVDYIFRRLAVEYLPFETRSAMGILTINERTQPTLPGVEEATTPSASSLDLPPDDLAPSAALQASLIEAPPAPPAVPNPPNPPQQARVSELVLCNVCGDIMQRAGTCHACPSCGATSGCS